jgi:hypothetical protein
MKNLISAVRLALLYFLLMFFNAAPYANESSTTKTTASEEIQPAAVEQTKEYPVDAYGTAYKVNPRMGSTCWVSVEADPTTLCGPTRPCGGLPEPASCYIVDAEPNCCSFCPASWSADC